MHKDNILVQTTKTITHTRTNSDVPRLPDIFEPRLELKKSVAAIHIGTKDGGISLLQRKIINILLYNAYSKLLEHETHTMRISELADMVGFDSKNFKFLKDSLRHIRDISIEWNILDDRGKEKWGISGILAEAEIYEGRVTYSYPPLLRRLLYNPEIFAKIDLKIQKRFSSTYALALYENCYRFRRIGKTAILPVNLCMRLLGVPNEKESYYSEFKNFNRKILKPATKEVTSVSDIKVEIEYFKNGKNVSGLRFLIQENVEEQTCFGLSTLDNKLYQRLIGIGVDDIRAHEILSQFDVEYVDGNLRIVEDKYDAIEYPVKYLECALKSDFRKPESPALRRKREKESLEVEKKRRAELVEEITHEFTKSRLARAEDVYRKGTKLEQKELEDAFLLSIKDYNSFLYMEYRKKGLKPQYVKIAFYSFIAEQTLTNPEDCDLAAFAASRGFNLNDLR